MKIAIFTDTYSPQINGVVKSLNKLLEYLDENNIDYRVFAPRFDGTHSTAKVRRFLSYKIIFYPQCRFTVPNYFKICKELDDFKPDIIHVLTEFTVGLCGFRYAKTRNIPVVSSYETNIPQYMQYYHLKFLEERTWKFFKWFHSSSKKCYCPSKATLKLLKSKGLINVAVWDRGIEIEKFSPVMRDYDLRKKLNIDNKVVFIYVGRISPEKDLHLMINVAKKLNEKYEDKIHFLMVGDGPSLKELKNIAPNNMTFTGFLGGLELSKIYASADIFMFTSTTETLGLVILEAMASGLPVISCNSGGVTDNLVDGYNCISCREKVQDDFYNAAQTLILNNTLRAQLSENARNYAINKDWGNAFEKLVKDYEEIINTKTDEKIAVSH